MVDRDIANVGTGDRNSLIAPLIIPVATEISALKKAFAFADDVVTNSYYTFYQFWIDTVGYHPFLDYGK